MTYGSRGLRPGIGSLLGLALAGGIPGIACRSQPAGGAVSASASRSASASGSSGSQSSSSTRAGSGNTSAASSSGGRSGPAASSSGGTGATGAWGAASVLTHHLHANRDGAYVDPALTHAHAAQMHLDGTFQGFVEGSVYAQPLYVDEGGDGSADYLVVATEENRVYALSAVDGHVLWMVSLGAPLPLADSVCGNIDPSGITGTPVIDPDAGLLYLDSLQVQDGGLPDGSPAQSHFIFALSLVDGSVPPGWPIDVSQQVDFDGGGFDAQYQQNRAALALVGGSVYVPFGARAGDCGDYHGAVVRVPEDAPAEAVGWSTPGPGGGVWGVSGIGFDGQRLWISTGNGKETDGGWEGGSAVLALDTRLGWALSASSTWVAPNFATLDAAGTNLGGTGVQLFDFAAGSSSPASIVTLLGENGLIYLLDRSNPGGGGSAALTQRVSSGAVKTAPAVITRLNQTTLVFQGSGANCPPGEEGGDLTALAISPGSPPAITTLWCATQNGLGSVIVSTIDGFNEGLVWGIGAEGDNRLKAFDLDTGEPIFAGGGPFDGMGMVQHFATPIAAKGHIYVGGDGRLYSFTYQ